MTHHKDAVAGGRIAVLGPIGIAVPAASDDETAMGFGRFDFQPISGQQGLVLALLAAAFPHVVASDTLIDAVWPTKPPRSAATGLRVVIKRLRDRLAPIEPDNPDPVTFGDPGYRLTLDAERFDHLTFNRQVDNAGRVRRNDADQAVRQLEAALQLWRGRAFTPHDRSEHLTGVAAGLESRRCEAEELLLETLLDAGRNESAAVWATSFVVTEPYRERRWELLMLALYRAGRQAEALKTAERVRSVLIDDLGVEPGPALKQLELDILNQEPHLDGPRSPARDQLGSRELVENLRRRPGAIPHTATTYVAPDDLHLADLAARSPMVTLVGPAGVGKSRLAARLVSGLLDGDDDGDVNDYQRSETATIHWLDLGDEAFHRRPDETLRAALAGSLGIRPTDKSLADEAAEALAGTPTVVVFDNADRLADEVAELAEELLEVCRDLRVVATSRFPIGSRSEKVYGVDPLTPAAAVELLVDRAPHAAGHLEADLLRLVEQVDRLPLAIELVVPHLAVLSPADVADRLVTSLDLASGRGRLDPRHRSLDQALAWSVDPLDDHDRALLSLLAVYNASVSTQQILDSGDNDEAAISAGLRRLTERGLLRSESSRRGPSWTMPNTVRTYVQTRLTPPVVLVDRRNAHAEYHLHLVRSLAVDLAGEREERAVAEWHKVADQLPAAHAWFVERGQARQSAALSLAVWEYSFLRQDYAAYGWLDDTLDIEGIEQIDVYPEALAQGALAAWAQDRFLRAEHLAGQAEVEAGRRGEPTPIAAYKARLNVAVHQDQGAEAARLLARLLAVSEEQGDARHHSDNLVVAALGYGQLGLTAEAAAAARQANELAVSLSNPTSVSWARVALAWAAVADDPDKAAQHFASAARLARTVDNRWVNGMATTGLVTVLRRQGRLDHARRVLAEVAELWVRARQQGQISRVCQEAVLLLGHAGATDGDRDRAAILLERFAFEGHRLQLLPDDQDRFSGLATTLAVRDRSAADDAPLGRLVIEALRG